MILIRSASFVKSARRYLKKHPDSAKQLGNALEKLAKDPYQPVLKTHKLKGNLELSWACSAGYDLRIIFSFITHEGVPAVLLETIGTHDEVY